MVYLGQDGGWGNLERSKLSQDLGQYCRTDVKISADILGGIDSKTY